MKNLFVFLFLCNFLLLCHAHGGGNYEHSDMLASMKPGDKAAPAHGALRHYARRYPRPHH